MNHTLTINQAARMAAALPEAAAALRPTAGLDFLAMASRLQAGSPGLPVNAGSSVPPAAAAPEAKEAPDPASLEAYREALWEKISQLPMSASSKITSVSVRISDAGLEAMRADPDYEAWVLDTLARDFQYENPWVSLCGGGYVVHSFGASRESYHAESWYPEYQDGHGASLFGEKSADSFWLRRAERQEEYMELQRKAAAKRRLMMKLRQGIPLSAAELLMGLI